MLTSDGTSKMQSPSQPVTTSASAVPGHIPESSQAPTFLQPRTTYPLPSITPLPASPFQPATVFNTGKPENVPSTALFQSKSAFPLNTTTAQLTSTQNTFSIPTEKEKGVMPAILSIPLSSKFSFGAAAGNVPFKFPLFDSSKSLFSNPKDPSSLNLRSGQTQASPVGAFASLTGDKSHQPAQLFSKSFVEPKSGIGNADTKSSSDAALPTFSFQGARAKRTGVPVESATNAISPPEGLFSKKTLMSVFGKNLPSGQSTSPQKTERKVHRNDRNEKPSRMTKALLSPKKTTSPVITEIRQRISPHMDVKELTVIICKGLHSDDNNRDTLLKHFSKFGEVVKVTCSPNQKHAIVQFTNHDSAEKAKKNGSLISTVHNPVSIFWCQKAPPRSLKAHILKAISKNKESEVDEELQSMLEGAGDHDLLTRPPEKALNPKVGAGEHDLLTRPPKKTLNPKVGAGEHDLLTRPPEKTHNLKVKEPKVPKSRPKSAKSSSSKTQVKSTESPSASASSTSVETWTKALTQAAHTPAEKFYVLDCRDKLMRLILKKKPKDAKNDKDSKSIGTCSDMCPEKERYHRFTAKTLALLEQSSDPAKLEHRIIVKEYSRSSADQDAPLPHELRPPKALVLTFDYLLCNVMDRPEDLQMAFGEWYDFIWNRTRGIRKDIKQQDLCDRTTVDIIEKCARFHIHCSATLCDEESSVFDPRINNLNLTQCLQSLREFYEDLAAKDITCPNEPEFRAYEILLNLNTAGMIRRVQQLSVSVRNSPEVRFAVSVTLAFQNNNYVRFFKLVSQASYFSACILHRYFTEVRRQALQTILKAYCMPSKTEQYPIEDLVALLQFENDTEAAEFCELVGLRIVEKNVILDRLTFAIPDSFPTSRAYSIVESKKTTSLGEAINQKPLPENPLPRYKPHDSFDEKDYLKKEAYRRLSQFTMAKVSEEPTSNELTLAVTSASSVPALPAPLVLPPPAPPASLPSVFLPSAIPPSAFPPPAFPPSSFPPPAFPSPLSKSELFKPRHEVVKPVIEQIKFPIPEVQPVIQPIVTEAKQTEVPARSSTADSSHYHEIFRNVLITMINGITTDMLRGISFEAIRDERLRQQEIRNIIIERISCTFLHELINDVVQEEVTYIARESVAIHQKEKRDLTCRIALNEFLNKCIVVLSTEIAREVHEEEEERWLMKLEAARKATMLSRVQKAFTIWHKASIKKRQMEAHRNTFPSCPILQIAAKSPTSHLLSTPIQASAVKNISTRLLESGVLCKAIKEELSWLPLNLTTTFENAFNEEIEFPQLSAAANYWKMLIVYFDDAEMNPNFSLISQWVCAKFTKGCEKVESFAGSKICSLYWLTDRSNHRIAVCVRSVAINSKNFHNDLAQLKKAALLDGTVAILMCFPSNPSPNFSKSYQHLQRLLETKSCVPSVPLYSLVIGQNTPFHDTAHKYLNDMQKRKLISEYEICTLDLQEDFCQLSEKVSAAVDWLVQRCPKVPKYTKKYLKDYFQDGFIEVFNIIFQDISHKKNQSDFYQDPVAIITFYNENIKLWCLRISSPPLNSVSWPPPELASFVGKDSLSWRKPEFLQKLTGIMEECLLPSFNGHSLFCEDALAYLQTVVADTKRDVCHLISSVNGLLRNATPIGRKEFLIPWADLIYMCVQFLYSTKICSEAMEEACVFYLQEELEKLNLTRRWKEISELAPILEFCDSCENDNEVTTSAPKRKLGDASEDNLTTPETSPSSEKRRRSGDSELEMSLKAEKEHSDAFSAMLQQAIQPFHNISDTLSLMDSPDCHNVSYGGDVSAPVGKSSLEDFKFSGDMQQQVAELEQSIESEKQAAKALDATLQALLL